MPKRRWSRFAASGFAARGRSLPFELGRQPSAGPCGEGRRLVVVDVDDRRAGIELGPTAEDGRHPSPGAVPLPVHRRLGIGVGQELGEVPVGDGTAIDPERLDLHLVAGPFVVVGETVPRRSDLANPPLDANRPGSGRRQLLGGRRGPRGLIAVDHLEQLEHRLVVLVLVGDEHLVGEPVPQDRVGRIVEIELVEHLEGPARGRRPCNAAARPP